MKVLEKYNRMLDERSAEELEKAAEAAARGDERERSIHLMQSSMLGEMLKVIGRVEHEGKRPGMMQSQIDALMQEAEKHRLRDDFDEADRVMVKARTIAWAQETLKGLENANE